MDESGWACCEGAHKRREINNAQFNYGFEVCLATLDVFTGARDRLHLHQRGRPIRLSSRR